MQLTDPKSAALFTAIVVAALAAGVQLSSERTDPDTAKAAAVNKNVGDTVSDAAALIKLGVAGANTTHATCLVIAGPELLSTQGIKTPEGKLSGASDVCVTALLPGGEPVTQDVPGAYVFSCVLSKTPCDPKVDPVATAWLQGNPKAAFACACAVDPTCTWTSRDFTGKVFVGPAPYGRTLDSGTWSGAGCLPKPCVEPGGVSSWPGSCPTQ